MTTNSADEARAPVIQADRLALGGYYVRKGMQPDIAASLAANRDESDELLQLLARHRLSHASAVGMPSREDVAWVIDPHGFRQWQSMYDYGLRVGDSEEEARGTADWAHGKQIADARAKADAILALFPAQTDGGE